MEPLYLILGYEGIIGMAFYRRISQLVPEYRLFCFAHGHVDITNRLHVREVLDYLKPTIVINCTGISDPEICEKAKSGAFSVNSVGAKIVAEESKRIGAKIVWFSSCHVVEGTCRTPRPEKCKTNPSTVVGKSKVEGEKAIRKTTSNHLIIRPGWIFNSNGVSVVSKCIERAERWLVTRVNAKCYGSPTFVQDMTDATMELINRDVKGTFNIANSGLVSLEDFTRTICTLSQLKPTIETTNKNVSLLPEYSVLSLKKYKSVVRTQIRSWDSALKQCLFQMKRFKP